MSEIKYKYLAIMHIGDTQDFPSALARRTLCDDSHIPIPVVFFVCGMIGRFNYE